MEPRSVAPRAQTVALFTGIAAMLLFALGLATPYLAWRNDKDPGVVMFLSFFASLPLSIVAFVYGVRAKRRGEGPVGLAVGGCALGMFAAAAVYFAVTA